MAAVNIHNVTLKISAGYPKQFPADPQKQVAFSGRSNVGKSSLINMLLSRRSLARVSASPGKTVTVNFYDIDKKLFLVDLPGYGFARRSEEDKRKWSMLTDGYFTQNPNIDLLRLVIQLVDSRIGPTEDDLDMLRYLRHYGIPYVVVATKSDKLTKTEAAACVTKIKAVPEVGAQTNVILCSSETGVGKDDIWKNILSAVS